MRKRPPQARPSPPPLTRGQLERLNIGSRYWNAEVRDLPAEAEYTPVVQKYASRIRLVRKRGYGLLLWGPNSSGKTYTAAALLKHVVRYGFTGYCIAAPDMKTCFIENPAFDDEQTVVERIHSVDFLVIEDLGKEYRGNSGWAESQFESLLRVRTRDLRPTLITTNLSPGEIEEVYNLSALELAVEMMLPVECKGVNFRHKIAKKMQDEILGGG